MSLLMLPAGIALAKERSENSNTLGVSIETSLDARSELHENNERDHDEDESVSMNGSATSTHKAGPWSNLDSSEDVRGRDNNESDESTSSHERKDDSNRNHRRNGGGNGFASFLSWFLGLPDSTTVGEVRAQINASTTGRSSIESDEHQEVGVFARLASFFHFGRSQDN